MDKTAKRMLLINGLLGEIRELLNQDGQISNVLVDIKIRDCQRTNRGLIHLDLTRK